MTTVVKVDEGGEEALAAALKEADPSRVSSLDSSDAELSSLPPLLAECTALRALRVSANPLLRRLQGLPETLSVLHAGGTACGWEAIATDVPSENLRVLELGRAACEGPAPCGLFARFKALKKLSLSGNTIGCVPAGAFLGLEALQTLALDHCELSILPSLATLSSLEVLRAHRNHLAFLPSLPATLCMLAAHQNELTNLDSLVRASPPLPKLTELTLGHNELSALPLNLSERLPSLRTLALEHNNFELAPALGCFASVREVRLEGNPLCGEQRRRLRSALPPALEVLYLSDDE